MTTLTSYTHQLATRVQNRVEIARQRARNESEQGEIIDKVIIVAATAAIAIAAMAAIAVAVNGKLGSLHL
jgi:hypothetical protein